MGFVIATESRPSLAKFGEIIDKQAVSLSLLASWIMVNLYPEDHCLVDTINSIQPVRACVVDWVPACVRPRGEEGA